MLAASSQDRAGQGLLKISWRRTVRPDRSPVRSGRTSPRSSGPRLPFAPLVCRLLPLPWTAPNVPWLCCLRHPHRRTKLGFVALDLGDFSSFLRLGRRCWSEGVLGSGLSWGGGCWGALLAVRAGF